MTLYPFAYFYRKRSQENGASGDGFGSKISAGRGNIQYGWKRLQWRRILGWINRWILATKTISNCWRCKNRFFMKSKRQKSAITFHRSIFHSQIRPETSRENRHYLDGKLIKLITVICHWKQFCTENEKLLIYKIFILLWQTLNSNFRLSANRGILLQWEVDLLKRNFCFVYTPQLKTRKHCEEIVFFKPSGSKICRCFDEHELITGESRDPTGS